MNIFKPHNLGFTSVRTIFKHALPNALAPVFVSIAFGIASAILIESGLSFLGIGVPDDIVTWGSLLNLGRQNLEAWDHTIGVMQDEDSIYRVTMEALEDLSNDGVVYAELRFAPLVHTFNGLSTEEIINSVINGIKDGMEKFDIVAGVILCAMRQEQNSLDVVNLCIEHKDVIGFDLAGPEVGFSVLNHKEACALAVENNINVTLHADWEVPEGIKEVVLDSKAKRVGHVSQIINDISFENGATTFNNDAAKYVFDNKIALEICPTSNVQCGAFSNVSEHSFGELYNAGFNVTINTDNRLMSDITTVSYTHLTLPTKA